MGWPFSASVNPRSGGLQRSAAGSCSARWPAIFCNGSSYIYIEAMQLFQYNNSHFAYTQFFFRHLVRSRSPKMLCIFLVAIGASLHCKAASGALYIFLSAVRKSRSTRFSEVDFASDFTTHFVPGRLFAFRRVRYGRFDCTFLCVCSALGSLTHISPSRCRLFSSLAIHSNLPQCPRLS